MPGWLTKKIQKKHLTAEFHMPTTEEVVEDAPDGEVQ